MRAGRRQRPDVVDHRGACRDRRAHHPRLARVDGDRDALRREGIDQRDHPRELVGFGDRRRAGTRRFAADVDQVRAVRAQAARVVERAGDVEIPAAVGERVGSDVDDAHHQRAREIEQVAAAAQNGWLHRAVGPTSVGMQSVDSRSPAEAGPTASVAVRSPAEAGPTASVACGVRLKPDPRRQARRPARRRAAFCPPVGPPSGGARARPHRDYAGVADGAAPAPGAAPVADGLLPDCVGFGGRGGRPAMMSSI